MSKVLVIGSGYLGSEIVCQFNEGHEVLSTSRSGRDKTHQFNVLDVLSYKNLPLNIDHIIYCVSADNAELDSYNEAYYLGVEKILSYYQDKNLSSFTFISSSGVYLENDGSLIDELGEVLSNSQDKSSFIVRGEGLVLAQNFTLGRVCRFSGIYGLGRNFLIKAAENFPDGIYDRAPHYTNRIHKIDGARAVHFLIERSLGGVWNISDSYPTERLEVMNFIRQVKGLDLLKPGTDYLDSLGKGICTGKKVANTKLVETGFEFNYPSYREGYS